MTKTGGYLVDFYDIYGRRLKDFRRQELSYLKALDNAWEFKEGAQEVHSFTISRAIFNSLDETT